MGVEERYPTKDAEIVSRIRRIRKMFWSETDSAQNNKDSRGDSLVSTSACCHR